MPRKKNGLSVSLKKPANEALSLSTSPNVIAAWSVWDVTKPVCISLEAGVISGYDSTPECAVTKLMFLLGHGLNQAEIRHRMNSDLAGEITKIQ